jgi:hypothetical protein
VTDFLDEKRAEITERLTELKPLVEEYQRLEAAVSALAGVTGSARVTSTTATTSAKPAVGQRRKPGRPRKSVARVSAAAPAKSATSTSGRRGGGRPKGSGVRAAQAVSLVQAEPGITIPQLATKMGIKQNYLYRVLPGLQQEGKVARDGRGWHPGKA